MKIVSVVTLLVGLVMVVAKMTFKTTIKTKRVTIVTNKSKKSFERGLTFG